MKTVTITDARKNLGKWLQAAARGEDIGIISGADVIALRKVEVESADYAWREYGLGQAEVTAYERAAEAQHERLREDGQVEYLTAEDLRRQRALPEPGRLPGSDLSGEPRRDSPGDPRQRGREGTADSGDRREMRRLVASEE